MMRRAHGLCLTRATSALDKAMQDEYLEGFSLGGRPSLLEKPLRYEKPGRH